MKRPVLQVDSQASYIIHIRFIMSVGQVTGSPIWIACVDGNFISVTPDLVSQERILNLLLLNVAKAFSRFSTCSRFWPLGELMSSVLSSKLDRREKIAAGVQDSLKMTTLKFPGSSKCLERGKYGYSI
jgi:hypothetical protein